MTSKLVSELRKALNEPVIRSTHHVLMREAADVLEQLQRLAPETSASTEGALRDALEMMYDSWENGDACYEDPDSCTGYLGRAFSLSMEEEQRVLALIPKFPSKKRAPAGHLNCGPGTPWDRLCGEPSCEYCGARSTDRAYYHGARQAAAMAHQSLQAMDEWINGGCGGRVPALKTSGGTP